MTQSVFVKSPVEIRKQLFKGSLLHNNVLFRRRGKVRLIQKAILAFFCFIPQPNQFFTFVLLVPPPSSCNGISPEWPAVQRLESQLNFTHISKQLERVTERKEPGNGWRLFLNAVCLYFAQEHRALVLFTCR